MKIALSNALLASYPLKYNPFYISIEKFNIHSNAPNGWIWTNTHRRANIYLEAVLIAWYEFIIVAIVITITSIILVSIKRYIQPLSQLLKSIEKCAFQT